MIRVRSDTWGHLEAESVTVVGPFLSLFDVTQNGKPFAPSCMIPVQDAQLITPSLEEQS